MFALEIDFHDGVSSSETLLVRRPQALIGSSEYAHVVIEGGRANLAELRVFRRLGDEFFCHTSSRSSIGEEKVLSKELFKRFAKVDLGEVTTTLTALDLDLCFAAKDSPDSAGIKVLREALSKPAPLLPAVVLQGLNKVILSFPEEMELIAGRSRKCMLRLDSPDVSSEHARVGYKDGEFWLEDLGSTNGTFLDGDTISGRVKFLPGQRVRLAGETIFTCIASNSDLSLIDDNSVSEPLLSEQRAGSYPCLLTSSNVIKPQKFLLTPDKTFRFGRDPINDIWIGASHISRNHSEIFLDNSGDVFFTDTSSNGCFLDTERLPYGEVIKIGKERKEIYFGPDLSMAICFNEEDESFWVSLWEDRVNRAKEEKKLENLSSSEFVVNTLEAKGLKNNIEEPVKASFENINQQNKHQQDKQFSNPQDVASKEVSQDIALGAQNNRFQTETYKVDESFLEKSKVIPSPSSEDVFDKEQVLSGELEPEGVFSKLAVRENLKNKINQKEKISPLEDSFKSSDQSPKSSPEKSETRDHELEKAIYGDSESDPAFAGKYQAGGLSKVGSFGAFLILAGIVVSLFFWLVNELFA